jgi:hypothetical protein
MYVLEVQLFIDTHKTYCCLIIIYCEMKLCISSMLLSISTNVYDSFVLYPNV